jgi:3D (Asp-Asp-Asp) domain-containing protein
MGLTEFSLHYRRLDGKIKYWSMISIIYGFNFDYCYGSLNRCRNLLCEGAGDDLLRNAVHLLSARGESLLKMGCILNPNPTTNLVGIIKRRFYTPMKQPNFRKCVISLTLSVSLLTGTALATAKANNWYAEPVQKQQQNLVVLKPQYYVALAREFESKEQANNLLASVPPVSAEVKKTAPVQPVALKATIKAAKQITQKAVAKPVQAKQSIPSVKPVQAKRSVPSVKPVQARRSVPSERLMKTEVAAKKQVSATADSTSTKVHTLETPSGKTIKYSRLIPVKATAYTAAAEENGLWGAFDFFGNPLKLGTIAVDPNVIPMGSTVFVTGYSFDGLPEHGMIAKATDQGSAIRGKRVDIFMPTSRADASKFGMQDVKIYIME